MSDARKALAQSVADDQQFVHEAAKRWKGVLISIAVIASASTVAGIALAANTNDFWRAMLYALGGISPWLTLLVWYNLVLAPAYARILKNTEDLEAERQRIASEEAVRWHAERPAREAAERERIRQIQAACEHEWVEEDILDNVRWGDGGHWETRRVCRKCRLPG